MTAENPREIAVSPRLLLPREQYIASALFAPSGAYLSWIELANSAPEIQDCPPEFAKVINENFFDLI